MNSWSLLLYPDDGRRAVARLVAALDRERRQPLGRVQFCEGTELPQVAEPRHGLGTGLEEGEHDARLLLVVAVREDDAEPVVGHLDERAEVLRLQAAVQEDAEVRSVPEGQETPVVNLSTERAAGRNKGLACFLLPWPTQPAR